jgi:GT2 family glycosyltransferase
LVSSTDAPLVTFLHNQEPLNQVFAFLPRQDVIEALNLDKADLCKGFISILDTTGLHLEDIQLQVEENLIALPAVNSDTIEQGIILSALSDVQQTALKERALAAGIIPKPDLSIHNTAKKFEYWMDYCTCSEDGIVEFEGWLLNEEIIDVALVNGDSERESILPFFDTFFRQDIIEEKSLTQSDIEAGIRGAVNATIIAPACVEITLSNGYVWSESIQHTKGKANKSKLISQILSDVNIYDSEFFKGDYQQALRRVQNIWAGSTLLDNIEPIVTHYGDIKEQPKVSLIIPIYGRYDFIQHQISCFSQDQDMANHEVIYVLDDPRIEREFNITCHGIFETFQFPFKTVFGAKNLGFAGANNLGAQQAQGQYVLALNSDILPSSNGWLSRLVTKFEQLENPGILGTTLVYEDNTVQHIGMSFEKDTYYPNVWMNYHPNKGMPLHLITRLPITEVESVTGACMLMENEFFQQIGGFDTCYILGDFEDSDLCLKALNQNKKIYVDGDEKLYHLERLSQNLVPSGDWKFKLTLLNGLYQKEKWHTLIEKVKEQHA